MLKTQYSSAAEGNRHLRQGNLEAAVSSFSKLIEKQPDNVDAYLYRSSAYIQLNLLEQALDDCNTITELAPQNHYAFLNRGAIYGIMDEDEKCIKEMTRCLELMPDQQDALRNRAYAYSRTGKIETALTDFNRLIELAPDKSSYYSERGNCFLSLQKYSEAIQDYTQALQWIKDSWELYSWRGYCFARIGKEQQANADYKRALELNPFDTAIKQNPEDITSYQQRGNLYYDAGQYQNALNDFSKFEETSELTAEILVCRGYCYLNLGEISLAKAEFQKAHSMNAYGDAIKKDPLNSSHFLERGFLNYYREDYQQALHDFTHAWKLGEQSEELLPFRGAAYMKLHEYTKAKQDYETAIQNHPDSPHAYNGLAWLLATCPDETFRDGKRSLKLAKRNCILLITPEWNDLGTLAAAYAATGNFDEAVRLAKESLALAPEHEKADCQTRLEHYEHSEPYCDFET
ncbi:tetratricopeptide repeat protein [Gimesia algae]|nr:tetratricopeptide repeat protein [Gimesia algae]